MNVMTAFMGKNLCRKKWLLQRLAKARLAYHLREWDKSEREFRALDEIGYSSVARVFLERIQIYRSSPLPEDWDGVYTMVEK